MSQFLVVDDHPLFAEALRGILASEFAGARIETAASLAEARAALSRPRKFDLVLLDLWLPDTHGLEGLISLRRLDPKLPILVVSAFDNPSVIERALVCGAAGFIAKSGERRDFADGVRRALDGDLVLPAELLMTEPPAPMHAVASHRGGCATARALLPDAETNPEAFRQTMLTGRQVIVLDMLCRGLLNKQIAHELEVGETTVKAHVGEVMRKLGVTSRTQAVLEVSRLDYSSLMYRRMGLDRASLRVL